LTKPQQFNLEGGKVIIFSAPSGSGKTTIVKHLLSQNEDLGFSISACTRDKRGRNEIHGKDYYFLSPEEFKVHIDNNDFVEWEEVYEGNFYGSLKSEIQRIWDEGKNVIYDVDVKGGLSIKEYFGDNAFSVFVKVPSEDALIKRLTDRDTESEEALSRRLYKVRFEMSFSNKFDAILLNDSLEETLSNAQRLYTNFIRS